MLNKLKYGALALAVLTASMSMSGCDSEDPADTAKDEADIDSQARAKVNKDDEELKQELAKAQAKDPSIKDMYYGVDDQGNKELHVVQEKVDSNGGSSAMSSVWPLLGGIGAGMLISNMMNSGGMSNYASQHPPRSYNSYPMSDERRRRNIATSGYVGSTRARTASSYVSSRPSSAYSTRSSGVFSSSSSARSGGYSAGG